MVGLKPPISPLFVPATRPDRFAKAAASGADVLIIDLEDAVAPDAKDTARAGLAANLVGIDCPIVIRINPNGTPWHEADLAAMTQLPVAGIMLPKTEAPDDLAHLAHRLGSEMPVIALIESVAGLINLANISSAPNLYQLAFGSIDFALDLGCAETREALLFARSQIVLHSRYARLRHALDGVTVDIGDEPLLIQDCNHAADLGFGGKLAIHPAQINPIRRSFLPDAAELDWARRVLQAHEAAGGAAVLVDGRMVDAPVWERARRILASGD